MQSWGTDNADTPLVSVHCTAYNHEPYIAQALDGFLMQKTNFPFEVIVHDDASTDRTAEVIHEYEVRFPKIIKPIYETENQYSKCDGSLGRIMDAACKGKYIAFCEGDDYWIDESKLQMQVDFLEANLEYGMCYTRAGQFFQRKQHFGRKLLGRQIESFEDLLVKGNGIPTLTVCLRSYLIKKYSEEIQPSEKNWLMGDYPRWLYVAHESKVKFLDSVTSVYRVLDESASHSEDFAKKEKFINSTFDIIKYFSDYAGLELKNDMEIKRLFSLATEAFVYDEIQKGKEYLSMINIKDIRMKKERVKYLVLKNLSLRKLYIFKIRKQYLY